MVALLGGLDLSIHTVSGANIALLSLITGCALLAAFGLSSHSVVLWV